MVLHVNLWTNSQVGLLPNDPHLLLREGECWGGYPIQAGGGEKVLVKAAAGLCVGFIGIFEKTR